MTDSLYERFYRVIRQVPFGQVATYGQIARLAGLPRHSRHVGYALNALSDTLAEEIPWHRVINSAGTISRRADPDHEVVQRIRLEAEGVEFGEGGRVSLRRFGWQPATEDEPAPP